jgi:hypothetical protein
MVFLQDFYIHGNNFYNFQWLNPFNCNRLVKESPLRKYNNCYNLMIFKVSDIEMFSSVGS